MVIFQKTIDILAKSDLLGKLAFLAKNRHYGKKLTFWEKIEILTNKSRFWHKIETLAKKIVKK